MEKPPDGWFNGNANTGLIKKQRSIADGAVLMDCDRYFIVASMISEISCLFQPYVAEAVNISDSLNEIPICSVSMIEKLDNQIAQVLRASASMSYMLGVRHIDPPSVIVDILDFDY